MYAFQRACFLKNNADNLFGVASSATLIKNEDEREGRTHRVAIAIHSNKLTDVVEYQVPKATRPEQEDIVSKLIMNTIGKAVGVVPMDTDAGRYLGTKITKQRTEYTKGNQSKLFGPEPFACYGDGSIIPSGEVSVILPGSFNPRHPGHQEMAEFGKIKTGHRVHSELSITNVDKPALDLISITDRVAQFDPKDIVLTNTAKAYQKAQLFPGSTFLLGMDTWDRILNPKYYQGCHHKMVDALEKIKASGCKFLVFGRLVDGSFRTLTHYPNDLPQLDVQAIQEEEFRKDISSTELRNKEKNA